LVIDRRGRGAGSDAAPHLADYDLQAQDIAGHDLSLKTNPVDAREEGDLALIFLKTEERHGTDLRQRFHDQDARHYWMAGEVSLEEWLAHRDVLNPNSPLSPIHFNDPIDQQEREAVGDDLLNLLCVKQRALLRRA
jgi:hypothetical protein